MATGIRKSSSTRKAAAAAKTAEAGAAGLPPEADTAEAAAALPGLRNRELVEQAMARTGVKKKAAKPLIDAVLAIMGEAVADGRELNLKPFGRMRVSRSQGRGNNTVFVCKLRQGGGAGRAAQENAPDGENSSPDPLAAAEA